MKLATSRTWLTFGARFGMLENFTRIDVRWQTSNKCLQIVAAVHAS